MIEQILKSIKENRHKWLEGFADPSDGADVKEHLIRVLESNLANADAELAAVPADEVKRLAEMARGANTLRAVLKDIRESNGEAAAKLLDGWFKESSDKSESLYAFPYSTTDVPKLKETEGDEEKKDEEKKDDEDKTAEGDAASDDKKPEAKEGEMTAEEIKAKEAELAVKESELKVKEKLSASGLPENVRNKIFESLKGKSGLTDENIDEAIQAERDYVASFNESDGGKPEGLGEAHDDKNVDAKVGEEEYTKIRKGFEYLLVGSLAQSKEDQAYFKDAPKFTSLHEAFGKVCSPGRWMSREETTDAIFQALSLAFPRRRNVDTEKWFPRLRESWTSLASAELREAITTASFPVAFGDALFRRMQKEYNRDELNDWRMIVSSMENLQDATNTMNIVRIGDFGNLPIVLENGPYQELTDPTEANETITPDKYGALVKLTWEDVLADRINVVRSIPRKLGRSTAQTIQEVVWDQIENNTALISDSTALIDTATHANRLSGDPSLSYADVSTAIEAMRNATAQDSGKKLGLRARFLLVSPDKEQEALEITESVAKQVSADDATTRSFVNLKGIQTLSTIGLGRASGTVNRWYLMVDPSDSETIAVGFLGGRDTPDIFVQGTETPTSGAQFDSDAITFKVRIVFGVTTVDFRGFQGSLASS